jgi:hypothetical protein
MPKPDALTMTLLTALQEERTNPENGWMSQTQAATAIGIPPGESFHITGALQELNTAGMIESRWNSQRLREEYRSRGTMPDITRSVREPVALEEHPRYMPTDKWVRKPEDREDDLLAEARALDPAPTTLFPAPLKGTVHAAFVLDYRTDKWATMCGKQIKDPSIIKHEHRPVQCPKCAEAVR